MTDEGSAASKRAATLLKETPSVVGLKICLL